MSDTRAQVFHTAVASLIHEELNGISSASMSNKEWAVPELSARASSAIARDENSGSFQGVISFGSAYQ